LGQSLVNDSTNRSSSLLEPDRPVKILPAHSDPAYSCRGVKELFFAVEKAAGEMGRELAPPESSRKAGKQECVRKDAKSKTQNLTGEYLVYFFRVF
jgi:hypothetical protein